jgi:hypothetical protein
MRLSATLQGAGEEKLGQGSFLSRSFFAISSFFSGTT